MTFWGVQLTQLSAFVLFIVLIGCSSSIKKPLSEAELLAQARATPLNAYREAMAIRRSDPVKACHTFKELSEQMNFFLKEESRIRAYELCDEPLPLINTDSWPSEISQSLGPFLNRIQLSKSQTLDSTFQVESLKRALQAFDDKKARLNFADDVYKKCDNEKCRADVERHLFDLDPVRDLQLRTTQPLKYVDALREQRRFSESIDILKGLIRDPKVKPEDKSQAYQKLRLIYKVSEKRKNYLETSVEYHNWALDSWKKSKKDSVRAKIYLDSILISARTLWTEDRYDTAQGILTEGSRLLKGLLSLEEVFFVLARMAEEKKDFARALNFYEFVDREPLTTTTNRAKYDWSKAWLQIKLKIFDQAAPSLADIATKTKDQGERFKALFWQAYALEKLAEKDKAKEILTKVASEDILGYYGMLSHYKLGTYLTPLTSRGSQLIFDDSSPLELRKAKMLIEAQDDEFSKVYLNNFKKSPQFAQYEIQTYLLYAKAQQYLAFFAALNASPMETKKTVLETHPYLVFPTDYMDLINEHARAFNVEPELVFSIIRQESTFNPNVKSPAEAYGLMQLISSTARKNAKKLKMPWTGVERLYEPEYNIKLGTYELSLLYKRIGNYIQLASSYNAAESAVRGWYKTRYNEDSLIFIEDIPYDETRSYVKHVIRNMVFYRRLLSRSPYKIEDRLFYLPATSVQTAVPTPIPATASSAPNASTPQPTPDSIAQ